MLSMTSIALLISLLILLNFAVASQYVDVPNREQKISILQGLRKRASEENSDPESNSTPGQVILERVRNVSQTLQSFVTESEILYEDFKSQLVTGDISKELEANRYYSHVHNLEESFKQPLHLVESFYGALATGTQLTKIIPEQFRARNYISSMLDLHVRALAALNTFDETDNLSEALASKTLDIAAVVSRLQESTVLEQELQENMRHYIWNLGEDIKRLLYKYEPDNDKA